MANDLTVGAVYQDEEGCLYVYVGDSFKGEPGFLAFGNPDPVTTSHRLFAGEPSLVFGIDGKIADGFEGLKYPGGNAFRGE